MATNLSDLEISKALAIAVGWKRMLPNPEADGLKQCWVWTGDSWRVFDYRDWNVIGPIAEKYECFPIRTKTGEWFANIFDCNGFYADTPQKAIALAVIAGASK